MSALDAELRKAEKLAAKQQEDAIYADDPYLKKIEEMKEVCKHGQKTLERIIKTREPDQHKALRYFKKRWREQEDAAQARRKFLRDRFEAAERRQKTKTKTPDLPI